MKPKTFVFDLDGTLANLDHRLQYVTTKPKNWGAFKALVLEDTVIEPVRKVLDSLRDSGFNIIFLSGREGDEKGIARTSQWIENNLDISVQNGKNLFMRKARDYRGDDVIKIELMNEFVEPFYDVIGIFDDRKRVVDMWRENGYFVFDVNQSGKDF